MATEYMLTREDVERRLKERKLTREDVERRLKLRKEDVVFYESLLKNWPEDKVLGSGWTAIQVLTPTYPDSKVLK
jgi:hypothetical protein